MEGNFAWLLERKLINYKNKEYEIFEVKDIVYGIKFTNNKKEDVLSIVTGTYQGDCYTILGGTNEVKEATFVIALLNNNKAIELNDGKVNFPKIKEKFFEYFKDVKYYIRGTETPIRPLEDKDLINFLEQQEKSEFDENIFEKTTDISKMYSSIKETIISQDEQIMQILTALFKNQKVINSEFDIDLIGKLKENILIYGPTGTGKTEILRRIAKIYNVPIVIEDATSLSETGYVGRKITDLLEDLYQAANKDVELAEKGILVIDEFDKLAEKPGDQSHVSRLGVQRGLLKLLDGTSFYFDNKKFDTSKLTVVALGAFSGIQKENDYKQVTTEDFIQYGIMQELIGRFSKTIPMNKLSKEDIKKILIESKFSPLNTYKKLFETMEIDFEYDDKFIDWIAEKAVALNTGARSLKTVFDDCISSAMFRIFAGEYSGITLSKPNQIEHKPYTLTKKNTK